jgi:hypothetical protein
MILANDPEHVAAKHVMSGPQMGELLIDGPAVVSHRRERRQRDALSEVTQLRDGRPQDLHRHVDREQRLRHLPRSPGNVLAQ